MPVPIFKRTGFAILALIGAVVVPCLAQIDDETVFQSEWMELESNEDLSLFERLRSQTDLLSQLSSPRSWQVPGNWEKATSVLNAWEGSTEIAVARSAYIRLLDSIGQSILTSGGDLAMERELRTYLQKALKIADNSLAEGKLLFHLAASLHRAEADSMENRRRVEAYLQQASLALGDVREAGQVHSLMGKIYAQWGEDGSLGEGEESYMAKAVFHYRYVLALDGADGAVVAEAESTLAELLQPGLQLNVHYRFMPHSDIRISLFTRNLRNVDVIVRKLPWVAEGVPLTLEAMERYAVEESPTGEDVVLDTSYPVSERKPVDWQAGEIRLGEHFDSGWYRVTVSGGDLVQESLLLVTSLDVSLIPRDNGNLTIWAMDAESGLPVPNVHFHLLGSSGEIIQSGFCDASGMADILTGGDYSWTELHVSDGLNPAVVRRMDIRTERTATPWVVSETLNVSPGTVVRWNLLGLPELSPGKPYETVLQLPDGSILTPEVVETLPGSMRCQATIPKTASLFGPVYLSLPEGKRVRVSYLGRPDPLPFEIELNGERFFEERDVFVSSAPVGIRIRNSATALEDFPDFIRVVVRKEDENFVVHEDDGLPAISTEILFERILRFGGVSAEDVYFELPELTNDDDPLPLAVEVYRLDSGQLIGQSSLGMIPYRALLEWGLSERIVTPGQALKVNLTGRQTSDSLTRSLDGELVVFRETWENRYIHRKRGTPLSESEYDELPDRSLLGSAKTDYRLLERSLVREEVQRVPVDPASESSVSLTLNQEGYYRVFYEGAESDVRARYPEGDMEIWVLPEDGDFSAFRSESPKLIIERSEDDSLEILVILDRQKAAVLIDMEDESGWSTTQILQLDSPGYFMRHEAGVVPLRSCRAIVSGEQRIDFVCRKLFEEPSAEWELGRDLGTGLNPGSGFELSANLVGGAIVGDPVWAFYPEETGNHALTWLKQQKRDKMEGVQQCKLEAVSQGAWLPLFNPLESDPSQRESLATGDGMSHLDPQALLSLLPVKQDGPEGSAPIEPIVAALQSPGNSFLLEGKYPPLAGRWQLVGYSPTGGGWLRSQSWPLSTELPIRTHLVGPAVLRAGDEVIAQLSIENTTRGSRNVNVSVETLGVLDLSEPVKGGELMAPGSARQIPVKLASANPGQGDVSTRVEDKGTSSEAFYTARVLGADPFPLMQSYLVPPGQEDWSELLQLKDWDSVEIHISSGMGSFLSGLWPFLRQGYVEREPLLVALTDWALEKVQRDHGIVQPFGSGKKDRLNELLAIYRSGSGIAWTRDHSPDPWLTGLVLWALDTFSSLGDDAMSDFREEAARYLERVMIDEDGTADSRLMALRTLSARAYHDPRIRPTRIQAKSFLEFFHNREKLKIAELAMLLDVARAYRFNEEVRLLTRFLEDRLSSDASLEAGGMWGLSLLHLAVDEGEDVAHLRSRVLDHAVRDFARSAGKPSWEQVGSLLNLLAEFLWEGDFSVDGTATVRLGDADPQVVQLAPHRANKGQLKRVLQREEFAGGDLNLQVDTSKSPNPVLISLYGQRASSPELAPFPGHTEVIRRKYKETTLLQGIHVHMTPADPGEVFQPRDILQFELEFVTDSNQPYLELDFAIPAGASLMREGIEYKQIEARGEKDADVPSIVRMENENPLRQVLRVEPLREGRHQVTLSYEVHWGGQYKFPAHRLVFPKTGRKYSLGESRLLRVEANSKND